MEHIRHLYTILDILNEKKLYVKFSKCEFWMLFVLIGACGIEKEGNGKSPKY